MKKIVPSVLALLFCALAPAALQAQRTIPAGTAISVSLDQSISSKDAKVGQSVAGTVSQNVVVGKRTVIPKGAKATLSVASVQASGRLSTPARLWLKLRKVEVNGKTYSVVTSAAGQTMGSKAKRDTVFIGGGAAAGALIGGLAGGGKGAVIGALAGGGAGTAGAAATGKKEVELPAEARLKFTTQAAATAK
jgi:hypothetical protein